MGKLRWLNNNLITSEDILDVDSLIFGLNSGPIKLGSGVAEITVTGNFTGETDHTYFVEIDSAGAVGNATFKFEIDGDVIDSAVTTSSIALSLGCGLSVAWTSGSGTDFVFSDEWDFRGYNNFNAGAMVDLNRDTRWRSSGSGVATIAFDFAASASANVLAIMDHNLTASATVRLFDSGSAVAFGIIWNADKIIQYITETASKNWTLKITDINNPDGEFRIGELYFGTFVETDRNPNQQFGNPIDSLFQGGENAYGVLKRSFFNNVQEWDFTYQMVTSADTVILNSVFEGLGTRSTLTSSPIIFHLNADDATKDFHLVTIDGMPRSGNFNVRKTHNLTLREVPRSIEI